MKTGFIHGYTNKPTKKRYSYHGVDRDCLIQPDPGPFDEYPNKPEGEEWIKIFDGSIESDTGQKWKFYVPTLWDSTDINYCPPPYVMPFNKYYFSEVTLFRDPDYYFLWMPYVDGLHCKTTLIQGDYQYLYKAWFNAVWPGSHYLWRIISGYTGSWARVWKSATGEFPGYFPTAQKEILY